MRNVHAEQFHQIEARLWFGANIPGASQVSDADWRSFLADSVTPHFPGFTVTTAEGYWKGEPELVRVVSILAEDTGSFRQTIRIIAEHYKSRFNQEAVAYAFGETAFTMEVWPHGPVSTYHKPGLGY